MVCSKTHNRRHSSSAKTVSNSSQSQFSAKEIENFQQKLVQLGFLEKDSFQKGKFDNSTKSATQAFQQLYEIKNKNGILDRKTLNKAEEAIKDNSIQPGIFGYIDSYLSGSYHRFSGSEGFISSCETGITNNHVTQMSRDDDLPTSLVTKNENGKFGVFPNQTLIPAPISNEKFWQPDLTFALPNKEDKSNITNCKWLTNAEISQFIQKKEPIFISTYRDDNDPQKNITEWPKTLPAIGTNESMPMGYFDMFSSKPTVVKVYPLSLKIKGTFNFSTVSASGNPQTIYTLIPPSKDGKPNMNIVGGSSGSPSYIVQDGKKQILGVHKAGISDWTLFEGFMKQNLYRNQFLKIKENLPEKERNRAFQILNSSYVNNDDEHWVTDLLFDGKIKSFKELPSNYPALVELTENYSKQIVSEIEILSKKYPDDFEETLPILNNAKLSYTEKWKELIKIGCELRMTDPIAQETVTNVLAYNEATELENVIKSGIENYSNKLGTFIEKMF